MMLKEGITAGCSRIDPARWASGLRPSEARRNAEGDTVAIEEQPL
jgi:hypothetical protein